MSCGCQEKRASCFGLRACVSVASGVVPCWNGQFTCPFVVLWSVGLKLDVYLRQLRKQWRRRGGDRPCDDEEDGCLCGIVFWRCVKHVWWRSVGVQVLIKTSQHCPIKGSQLFFNSGIRFVQRMIIHVIEGFWLFWRSGGRGTGPQKNLASKICVRRFIVSNMRFLVRGCM